MKTSFILYIELNHLSLDSIMFPFYRPSCTHCTHQFWPFCVHFWYTTDATSSIKELYLNGKDTEQKKSKTKQKPTQQQLTTQNNFSPKWMQTTPPTPKCDKSDWVKLLKGIITINDVRITEMLRGEMRKRDRGVRQRGRRESKKGRTKQKRRKNRGRSESGNQKINSQLCDCHSKVLLFITVCWILRKKR